MDVKYPHPQNIKLKDNVSANFVLFDKENMDIINTVIDTLDVIPLNILLAYGPTLVSDLSLIIKNMIGLDINSDCIKLCLILYLLKKTSNKTFKEVYEEFYIVMDYLKNKYSTSQDTLWDVFIAESVQENSINNPFIKEYMEKYSEMYNKHNDNKIYPYRETEQPRRETEHPYRETEHPYRETEQPRRETELQYKKHRVQKNMDVMSSGFDQNQQPESHAADEALDKFQPHIKMDIEGDTSDEYDSWDSGGVQEDMDVMSSGFDQNQQPESQPHIKMDIEGDTSDEYDSWDSGDKYDGYDTDNEDLSEGDFSRKQHGGFNPMGLLSFLFGLPGSIISGAGLGLGVLHMGFPVTKIIMMILSFVLPGIGPIINTLLQITFAITGGAVGAYVYTAKTLAGEMANKAEEWVASKTGDSRGGKAAAFGGKIIIWLVVFLGLLALLYGVYKIILALEPLAAEFQRETVGGTAYKVDEYRNVVTDYIVDTVGDINQVDLLTTIVNTPKGDMSLFTAIDISNKGELINLAQLWKNKFPSLDNNIVAIINNIYKERRGLGSYIHTDYGYASLLKTHNIDSTAVPNITSFTLGEYIDVHKKLTGATPLTLQHVQAKQILQSFAWIGSLFTGPMLTVVILAFGGFALVYHWRTVYQGINLGIEGVKKLACKIFGKGCDTEEAKKIAMSTNKAIDDTLEVMQNNPEKREEILLYIIQESLLIDDTFNPVIELNNGVGESIQNGKIKLIETLKDVLGQGRVQQKMLSFANIKHDDENPINPEELAIKFADLIVSQQEEVQEIFELSEDERRELLQLSPRLRPAKKKEMSRKRKADSVSKTGGGDKQSFKKNIQKSSQKFRNLISSTSKSLGTKSQETIDLLETVGLPPTSSQKTSPTIPTEKEYQKSIDKLDELLYTSSRKPKSKKIKDILKKLETSRKPK